VIGQNAVENNRMLHREEVDLIQNLAKEYAKEKGISVEEAETQLTRGALYNIDEGWKDAFDSKLDVSDIAEYNLAYQYLLAQTKDGSVDEINSDFYNYTDSKGTIVVIGRPNSYAGHISDSELQKAVSYIGEAGKGFIATAEDFKNKDIFLTNILAGNTNKGSEYYNDKKEFIQNSAAIKDSEISFFEGLSSSVDRDISEAKGAVIGVATGAKDTVIGIYEFLKHPIDHTKGLISAAADAVKNPVQTAKNVSGGIDQGLEKYNATIDLYKMQKDEGAEAEYKANIAGQIVGAGGVGAVGKKGTEAVVDSVKKAQQVAKDAEIAEALKKKQSIENNANVENPSFGGSAIRDFQPGTTHKAENINAGQVTDRDGLVRVNEEVSSKPSKVKTENDNQIKEMTGKKNLEYHATGYPAWKPGTTVTDRVVTEPEKMRMVIDSDQYQKLIDLDGQGKNPAEALGGWATKESVNSVADMRNKLALTEEFKGSIKKNGESNKFYIVEFEVQSGVGLRDGQAGSMYDYKTGQVLSGNAHQVNFMEKTPRTNPELFKLDLNNIKEIK